MSVLSDPVVTTGLGLLGIPPLPDLGMLDDHIAVVENAAAYHRRLGPDTTSAYRLGSANQGAAASAVRADFTSDKGAVRRSDDLAGRLSTTADGLRICKYVIEWVAGLLAVTAVAAVIVIAYFPELLPRLISMARRFFDMILDAVKSIGRLFDRLGERGISKKVDKVASRLHEQWRSSRRLEDGTFEPRLKTTTDSAWIKKHGTDQIDIANTRYENLPADWQKENKASADVAVRLVTDGRRAGVDVHSPDFVESASAKVHDAWLERNGEWAPPEQQLPYEALSEEEKAKDRFVVLNALEV